MRQGQNKVKARPIGFEFGHASTGSEQIGIQFQLIGGDRDGDSIVDFAYFTPASMKFTFEKLRNCGWDGSEPFIDLPGFGSAEVELVLEDEEYEGEVRERVVFVNRIGIPMKNKMDAAAKADFATRMRGEVAAFQQESGIARPAQSRGAAKPAARGAAAPRANGARPAADGAFEGPPLTDEDLGF